VQVTRILGAGLVATVVSMAVAGCGGDDAKGGAAAKTPAGFRQIKASDFRLAVPNAWTSQAPRPEDGGEYVEVRSPGTDVNRAQLRVGSKRGYRSGIDSAVKLVLADIPVRRPGARQVVLKTVDVPGAKDARRVEWTVPGGGGLDPARIVTVLALGENRTLVNLSLGLAQGQVAHTPVDDLVRSLSVG
jgi:hypothetical protein